MIGRLHLLSGFCLLRTEQRIAVPTGMQRLLAFIALRGPLPRSAVAGTLWPEVPEAQALACLRTGVWRLNRMLPGVLRVDAPHLEITEALTVDAREQDLFATMLLRGHHTDADWLSGGLHTLWRGDLLPGWYDDWVVSERERLSQLRLHALERSARVFLENNDVDMALQLALEAVRAEPLRETAHAALISVYLAEGNVVDAIHQRDTFTGLLQRELGLTPSPALDLLLPGLSPR